MVGAAQHVVDALAGAVAGDADRDRHGKIAVRARPPHFPGARGESARHLQRGLLVGVNQDEVQFNIGDYQLDFSGNRQAYDFKIKDLDADLDVQGDGKLSANGQYEIDVKIESAGEINARVKSMLDVFAAKDGYNKYRISQTGRLPPNMVRQLF